MEAHPTQKNTYHRYRRGFTFIETVIAIGVLIVSVVAPLSLAAQGLRTARIARDQVIANYLAQEGVEFLRLKRDNNALAGESWLRDISDCVNGCTIDVPHERITQCGGSCPVLQFDDATGRYGYDNDWADTKFVRTVSLTYSLDDPAGDKEAFATVSVAWSDVFVSRTFTLNEKLFNWQ